LSELAGIGIYPHYSFWEKSKNFALRLGTHKTKSHRASIIIGFSDDSIYRGFDLTHSLEEAQKLSLLLKDKDKLNMFAGKLNRLEGYSLYLPDTGINTWMPLEDISIKGFEMLLRNYNPKAFRNCYFRIQADYEEKSMNVNEAVKLAKQEYKKLNLLPNLSGHP